MTGNLDQRRQIFRTEANCIAFLQEVQALKNKHEARMICFVVMPDHFHLIVNPRDGDIQTWTGVLKSLSAKRIVQANPPGFFTKADGKNQVWQESFKSLTLWSGWMIWQKINYIHQNPIRANLVKSAIDYRWSSFRSFYGHPCEELMTVDHEW